MDVKNRFPHFKREDIGKISVGFVFLGALLLVLGAAMWSIANPDHSDVDEWTTLNEQIDQTFEQWKEQADQEVIYPTVDGKVPINTAPAEQLQMLPGIGPTKAQEIVTYRDQNGFFQTVEQLQEVKGIGEKTLENVKPYITVQLPEDTKNVSDP